MFGAGAGLFDSAGASMQEKSSPGPKNRKANQLLGDFTLYKVNKELENF